MMSFFKCTDPTVSDWTVSLTTVVFNCAVLGCSSVLSAKGMCAFSCPQAMMALCAFGCGTSTPISSSKSVAELTACLLRACSITDLSVSLCVYSFVMLLIPLWISVCLCVSDLSCCRFHHGSQSVYVSQICHVVDSTVDLSLFMCLQLCHVVDSIMDLSLFMYACVYFLWWCHVVDHIPLCTGTLVLQSCRVTSLGRNCPLSLASANGLCNHQQ